MKNIYKVDKKLEKTLGNVEALKIAKRTVNQGIKNRFNSGKVYELKNVVKDYNYLKIVKPEFKKQYKQVLKQSRSIVKAVNPKKIDASLLKISRVDNGIVKEPLTLYSFIRNNLEAGRVLKKKDYNNIIDAIKKTNIKKASFNSGKITEEAIVKFGKKVENLKNIRFAEVEYRGTDVKGWENFGTNWLFVFVYESFSTDAVIVYQVKMLEHTEKDVDEVKERFINYFENYVMDGWRCLSKYDAWCGIGEYLDVYTAVEDMYNTAIKEKNEIGDGDGNIELSNSEIEDISNEIANKVAGGLSIYEITDFNDVQVGKKLKSFIDGFKGFSFWEMEDLKWKMENKIGFNNFDVYLYDAFLPKENKTHELVVDVMSNDYLANQIMNYRFVYDRFLKNFEELRFIANAGKLSTNFWKYYAGLELGEQYKENNVMKLYGMSLRETIWQQRGFIDKTNWEWVKIRKKNDLFKYSTDQIFGKWDDFGWYYRDFKINKKAWEYQSELIHLSERYGIQKKTAQIMQMYTYTKNDRDAIYKMTKALLKSNKIPNGVKSKLIKKYLKTSYVSNKQKKILNKKYSF